MAIEEQIDLKIKIVPISYSVAKISQKNNSGSLFQGQGQVLPGQRSKSDFFCDFSNKWRYWLLF